MTQEYTPVSWQDETTSQQGTLINAERLNQMQTAHHYADGFEEVDTAPTADPGVGYHKVVYCTADSTFYRWDGTQWQKDIDDDTKALLLAHEADHANPHQVTKAQVGLGNADNTSDADKPISTATQTALNAKADQATTYTKAQTDTLLDGKLDKQDSSQGPIAYTADDGTEGSTEINAGAKPATIPIRTADGRLRAYFDDADPYADDCVTYTWTSGQLGDIRGTLDYKADKATTLAGYGITDAYTKSEADTLLAAKADQATTYTKTETDTLLGAKANDNAVVKLTGDQTIQGVKTFYSTAITHLDIQSSRASGNLGGIYYKNGSGVVKEQINGTAEGNLNLYPDSTQGGAVKIIGQRAYNASNTDDVATIGTLDAYTPMVRTTGNQHIAGTKSYSGTCDYLVTFYRDTNPSGTLLSPYINFKDPNGNNVASINCYKEGNGSTRIGISISHMSSIDNTVKTGTFRLSVNNQDKTVLQIIDVNGNYHTVAEY